MDGSLKYSLIEKLVNTTDEAVLNQVSDFLSQEKNYWDSVNPKLKASLDEALLQVEKKEYLTHEQVIATIKQTGRA